MFLTDFVQLRIDKLRLLFRKKQQKMDSVKLIYKTSLTLVYLKKLVIGVKNHDFLPI